METKERRYEGGCLCGEVRYSISGDALFAAYCHCRSCTLSTGSDSVAWATFEQENFAFTRGTPTENRSSAAVRRTFCGRCGTPLTYTHTERSGQIDVTLSTIDDPGDVRPVCHVWVLERRPWLTINDGLPRYSDWPGSAEVL